MGSDYEPVKVDDKGLTLKVRAKKRRKLKEWLNVVAGEEVQ